MAKVKLNKQKRLSLQQASVLFFVGLALLLFLALFSYDSADPGFFNRDNNYTMPLHNKAGIQGAWVADLLFGLFGNIAYLTPMILIALGFTAFRVVPPNPNIPRGGVNTAVSVFGAILALLSITSLSNILITSDLHHGAGGALGKHISVLTQGSFLGRQGSVLMMFSGFLIGITLAADIQWGKVTEKVGDVTLWLFEYVQNKVSGNESDTTGKQIANVYGGILSKPVQLVKNLSDKFSGSTEKEKSSTEESTDKDTTNEKKLQVPPDLGKESVLEQDEKQQDSASIATKRLKNTEVVNPNADNEEAASTDNSSSAVMNKLLPSVDLLNPPPEPDAEDSEQAVQQLAYIERLKRKIPSVLDNYGIKDAVVEGSQLGPVVTRLEVQLSASTKVSKVTNLAKDLARNLGVPSIRIVEIIPGKTTIGFEVPNQERNIVAVSEVLASSAYQNSRSALTLGLGKDIAGQAVVADLAKMPHLLLAGSTGSGLSVAINTLLISLLFKATPEQLRLLLIDPKMLELSVYNDLPHLLTPVITDMQEATSSLAWCVKEMERRYLLMSKLKVKNIAGYNEKVQLAIESGSALLDPLFDPIKSGHPKAEKLAVLPQIVIVIDEFADMIMVVGKTVEKHIARIAQKARATGIHLMIATQRPSVEVVTNLIKANIPTRIAFQVANKIDSRTILDQGGAESLLSKGDMLYLPPGTAIPQRIHGAFITDDEVANTIKFICSEREPDYIEGVIQSTESNVIPEPEPEPQQQGGSETDPLYEKAVIVVTESRRASISYLQRRLKVGYNRAARMMEEMETSGVVSAVQSNGTREVIISPPSKS